MSLRAADELPAAWQSPDIDETALPKTSSRGHEKFIRKSRWRPSGSVFMAIGKMLCVYIMANAHNTVLYTGVTNDLARRVYEHRNGTGSSFTKKYNVHKLVYYEIGDSIQTAIVREKQIKSGSRQRKVELINKMNPFWRDLSEEIF